MSYENYERDSSVYSEPTESEYDPNDERWDDWEEECIHSDLKCLFCENLYSSANDLFVHCTNEHGFDFIKTRAELKLDFYQCIRLINYIRQQVLDNHKLANCRSFSISESTTFLDNDKYLKPILDDDPLLYVFESTENDDFSDDDDPNENINTINDSSTTRLKEFNPTTPLEHELLNHLRITEQRLHDTEAQLRKMTNQVMEYREMFRQQFVDTVDHTPNFEEIFADADT
ncbi:10529_t:CDS:2 [Paraglomus occultum]|uniref:type I protein arginine methyltransferase n=1 Tax=Paraglomus occultum TaxID=144539 RepID=A0A9N8WN45_9GLOM|nr:10529_t:CDS:2 [Paraglomus occultum]